MYSIDIIQWWMEIFKRLQIICKSKVSKGLLGFMLILLLRKLADKLIRKRRNLPPGPCGFPILGMTPYAFFNQTKYSVNLGKYGPVAMVYYGMKPCVYINDVAVWSKYYKKYTFENVLPAENGTNYESFITVNGDEWKKRRHLFNAYILGQLNNDKISSIYYQAMIERIFPKIDKCIENNQPWLIRKEIGYLCFIPIYRCIFKIGDVDINDETFEEFWKELTGVFSYLPIKMVLPMLVPQSWLQSENKVLKSILTGMQKCIGIEQQFHRQIEIVEEWIERTGSQPDKSYYSKLKKMVSTNNMLSDIRDVLNASIHSLSTVLEQCILNLAKCGINLQDEIYHEIKTACNINNSNNDISQPNLLKNVKKLHLLNAFISETLRLNMAVLVPVFRSHDDETRLDINNQGDYFTIPQNVPVIGNRILMHHQPVFWNGDNVWDFDHTRFLNPQTKKYINCSQLVPFGLGKRDCPGQDLARKQLLIIVGLFIYNYKFTIPDNYNKTRNGEKYNIEPQIYYNGRVPPQLGVSVTKRE